MDKNTIIGFIMIALILVGFSVMNTPSEEELARQQRYNDSIALVEKTKQQQVQQLEQQKSTTQTDSLTNSTDSLGLKDAFGVFDVAAKGENKTVVLENELVKLHISTLGGRIVSAELKNYKTHDAKPLILFNEKESQLGFTISTNNNRVVNTSALYFSPVSAISKDKNGNQTLTMRLNTSAGAYLDFVYTLPANDYMVGLSLKANGMNSVVPAGVRALDMQWASKIRQQEKGYTFEARYSQIHYKFVGDDVEKMSESSEDTQEPKTKVKWISYSGQFFSTIFIADDAFTSTKLKSVPEAEGSGYLKSYEGEMAVSFDPSGKTPTNLHMFFGPNQYKVLSAYDDELEGDNELSLNRIIPLGWGIFGWVNRFAIIPMFN
ncbi:MAG: membrane protein insertase YidC [Paludibacter sp.]